MKKILSHVIALTLLCTLLLSAFAAPVFAAPAEETTPTGIKLDELETKIDLFMEEHIGVASPGAAVAVIKNGEVAFSGTYGLSDIENNTPVTADTVFEYGSISKLFVWVSAMQLVEQGRLDLDTDIRTYLPDDFNQKWKTNYPITMRQIMNHSAGYGEYPFDLILSERTEETSLEEALLSAHPAQFFEPGSASAYSNYATALAGYVVECIAGQEFYRYQKENIFDKIGMNTAAGHPYWEDNIGILEDKAQGYTKDKKGNFNNFGWSYIGLYPAGSINGTLNDLTKFTIALMPDGTASPLFQNQETLNTMLTPSYSEDSSGTAHGFFELDSATAPAFAHGGNTIAFSALLLFVPEEQFGLVMLTNTSNETDILYGLSNLLIGNKPLEQPDSGQEMPDAHDLAGNYVPMRRYEKTLMEFSNYLSVANVQAIDNNTLRLNMSTISGEYVQTAPYVFEATENSDPIIRSVLSKLTFKMENGVPVQIMVGKGMDLSAFPSHRSPVNLILSIIILAVSVLFFLITPIVLIISAVRRKKKNVVISRKFSRIRTGLTLCGTALLINNAVLILSVMSNPFIRYSQVFIFGIINYLIAAASVAALILGIINFRKQTTRAQKTWFVITGIVLILFTLLLVNWNVFILYI